VAQTNDMNVNKQQPSQPVTIKKYANRRLYNTGTSAYVTLEDLAAMVKSGEDFVVYDAKSGDDITRSVLTQIIFEQESKVGQSLLPIAFLRQLIRFYGDSMQMLVPSYLEFTIDKLTNEQGRFRDQMLNAPIAANPLFSSLEEQTRKNMAMFNQALAMFSPFGTPPGLPQAESPVPNIPNVSAPPMAATPQGVSAPPNMPVAEASPPPAAPQPKNEIDEMKRQLEELQKRIEGLSRKE